MESGAGTCRGWTAAALPETRGVEEGGVEPEHLARWFDTHHDRLYRLARRLCGDPEEARDIVQETFLRLARSRSRRPASDAHAEAWLVRTLVNLCRDHHRKRKVRRQVPAPDPASSPGVGTPESAAVARSSVEAALARLPARRRAVVVLHELEELDAAEIARRLGLARVTVRWHLHAGRRDLKRILLGEEKRS